MITIKRVPCKDCSEPFLLSAVATETQVRAGLTPPERCPRCRKLHSRETTALSVSHSRLRVRRVTGEGGLARFARPPRKSEEIGSAPPVLDPLPIDELVGSPEIVGSLLHNLVRRLRPVSVVVGPTGSGKSTWLPYRLLCCEELVRDGPIVVTQPRIPAAEEIPARAAFLLHGDKSLVGPGLEIGFRHSRVGRDRCDHHNRLVYMTDGTLLNEIVSGAARRYSTIIIDEAHERSVNIDLILALLREKLPLYPTLRVVVASATLDARAFVEFFGGPDAVWCGESKGFTYETLRVWADEEVAAWTPQGDLIAMMSAATKIAPGLRWEPEFEVLVHRGRLGASQVAKLIGLGFGDEWAVAITSMYGAIRQGIPRLRAGHLRRQSASALADPPMEVTAAGEAVVLDGVVRKVVQLCDRDEVERLRRLDRWERRDPSRIKQPEPRLRGDILVFLHASKAIEDACRHLREKLDAVVNDVMPFYSALGEQEKARARDPRPSEDPKRRIIVATNLAETSLTTNGLVYVVESGIIKQDFWDSERGESRVRNVLHSRAGCRQRIGRVGRTEPGEAHLLYTEDEFERQHAPFTIPEIRRSRAEGVVLQAAAAGFTRPDAIRWLDPPPPGELQRSTRALRAVGAIDDDGELTVLGHELSHMGADNLVDAGLLLSADRFACLAEVATFLVFARARYAGGEPVWWRRPTDDDTAELPAFYDRREHIRAACADDLELYIRLWSGWLAAGDKEQWSRQHTVDSAEMASMHVELGKTLEQFQDERKGEQQRPLFMCRLPTVRLLVARMYRDRIYRHDSAGCVRGAEDDEGATSVFVHPLSAISPRNAGSFVCVGLRHASAVSLPWLDHLLSADQVRVATHVLRLADDSLMALSDDTALACVAASCRDTGPDDPVPAFPESPRLPKTRRSTRRAPDPHMVVTGTIAAGPPFAPPLLPLTVGTETTWGACVPQGSWSAGRQFLSRIAPAGTAWQVRPTPTGAERVVPLDVATPALVVASGKDGSVLDVGLHRLEVPVARLTVGSEVQVTLRSKNGGATTVEWPHGDPWERFARAHGEQSVVRARVRARFASGIAVEVDGVSAVVRIVESEGARASRPGDWIDVIVERVRERKLDLVAVDPDRYRQAWSEAQDRFPQNAICTGRLVAWWGRGGKVALGDGVLAILPGHEVSAAFAQRASSTQLGFEVTVRVLRNNSAVRRILVSQVGGAEANGQKLADLSPIRLGTVIEARASGSLLVSLSDGAAALVPSRFRPPRLDALTPVRVECMGPDGDGEGFVARLLEVLPGAAGWDWSPEDVAPPASRPSHGHGDRETEAGPEQDQHALGAPVSVRLVAPGGERTWYADVVMNASNMRGVVPPPLLAKLRGTGFRLNFHDGFVELCALAGAPSLLLGERALRPGVPHNLGCGSHLVVLEGIELVFSVAVVEATR